MKYRVEWTQVAIQALAQLWLDVSIDRSELTRITREFDIRLESSPLTLGESRASSVSRIAYEPPVGIQFEVIEDDKFVIVQMIFSI